jgi:hypothetical protein
MSKVIESTTQAKTKNGMVLKPCSCNHEYQQSKYGNMRWHNLGAKGSSRCTVCGTKKV